MTTNKYYKRLLEIQNKYPELTDNRKYDNFHLSWQQEEQYKEQLAEIHNIIKQVVSNFTEFRHFVKNKQGQIGLRCECVWEENTRFTFTGGVYYLLDDFKEFDGNKKVIVPPFV